MNQTAQLFKANNSDNDSVKKINWREVPACVGNSFELLKEDFLFRRKMDSLPDSLLVEVETMDRQIVDKLFVFPTGKKEPDCVIVNNWEELSEYYPEEAISKYGFRVSWVKEIHSSIPWTLKHPSGATFYF